VLLPLGTAGIDRLGVASEGVVMARSSKPFGPPPGRASPGGRLCAKVSGGRLQQDDDRNHCCKKREEGSREFHNMLRRAVEVMGSYSITYNASCGYLSTMNLSDFANPERGCEIGDW
jgi:hypothetical protein